MIATMRDPTPGPPERAAEVESRQRMVERALRRLSEPLRAVIVLRYLEDLPYEEIAEVLGISLGTVRSRLRLAREVFTREVKRLLAHEDAPRKQAL